MVQSITALAIFTVLGASVIAVPLIAAQVGQPVALAKSDRLTLRGVPRNCFKQVWPDFDTACLRNGGSEAKIVDARLVAVRH